MCKINPLERGKHKASGYRSTMTPTKWYVKNTFEKNPIANEVYGVSTDGTETTPDEVYGVGTDGIETTPNEVYGVSSHPLQGHV